MFHFSIRDVLWLTVVVALGVGWWVEHRRAENAAALAMKNAKLELINATVTAAWKRALVDPPTSPPLPRD